MAVNHTSPSLTSITDVAVSDQAPYCILVATAQGHVHLFSNVSTPAGLVWSCHGGSLRVGWVGTQPIAWNSDPASAQLFVLGTDGQVRKQHAIPPHCDVAVTNDGYFVATGVVRLAHYELARDGSYSREVRNVSAPGSYDTGSLNASATGAVVLRSGGILQVQTKPSHPWQDVKAGGVAPALSTRGTRLATAWPHSDGSHVQVFAVSDSGVALETPYAVRALPSVITKLAWSLDESMLVAYSRDDGDVRVLYREGWVPGLWTNSAIRPQFHPSGVVTVPAGRDRLVLHDPHGASARTWTRWRTTTPETFVVGGAGSMRRGDRIVVFDREPRTRPTAIYEVVEAHRKDDDTRGLPDPPAVCRIRLGLAPVSDDLLDAEAAALAVIERSETGEVDLAATRSLMERLLVEQPSALEQVRIHLATSAAIQSGDVPAQVSVERNEPQGATVNGIQEESKAAQSAIAESETDSELGPRSLPLEATAGASKDRQLRAASALEVRGELLGQLYDAYMDNPSVSRLYDGRKPEARQRAREAEWLRSHGFVTGSIGADHYLSLRLTPAGRDHFEALQVVRPADSHNLLTNGESTASVGAFKPMPVPDTIPPPRDFGSMIGAGVDVLLVTAVDVERDAMLSHLQPLDGCSRVIRTPIKDHVYFLGRLGSNIAALVMTRMGASMRDGSTLSVYEAIGVCRPRAVIAVGIAWGMSTKLRLGDVLISTQIVAFDVVRRQADGDVYRAARPEAGGLLLNRFRNVTGWTFDRGDGRKPAVKDGPMLSGESLIDDLDFKTKLNEAFPDAIGGEMEGTGIYGASAKNRGEWIIAKAICDWADGSKDKRAQPLAAGAAASLVAHVVSEAGTLDSLPRMGGLAVSVGEGARSDAASLADLATLSSADVAKQPLGEAWRIEKRETKRAEVAADALVAALAFLDGLITIVSIFVMHSDDPNPTDPRGIEAWRREVEERWAKFAPVSDRFVDTIRLAETYLPDQVNELFNRVWMERATIKAAQSTYFQTPEANDVFREGFGSRPDGRISSLRDECRRLLRPIVQLQ